MAKAFWNRIKGIESKIKSLNTTVGALEYDTKLFSEYVRELLMNMKSDEYIDNVEILIEPFRCGVKNNDMRLIKQIIAKIDVKNKDKISSNKGTLFISCNKFKITRTNTIII